MSNQFKILKNAKNPILIIGEDAITGVEGKQIMNLAKLIANKFNVRVIGQLIAVGVITTE